jgi:hypothetical protein
MRSGGGAAEIYACVLALRELLVHFFDAEETCAPPVEGGVSEHLATRGDDCPQLAPS